MSNVRYVIKLRGKLWKETLYKKPSKALQALTERRRDALSWIESLERNLKELHTTDRYSKEEAKELIERYTARLESDKKFIDEDIPEIENFEIKEVVL